MRGAERAVRHPAGSRCRRRQWARGTTARPSRRQARRPGREDLRLVRAAHRVARTVGARLGERALVQRRVPTAGRDRGGSRARGEHPEPAGQPSGRRDDLPERGGARRRRRQHGRARRRRYQHGCAPRRAGNRAMARPPGARPPCRPTPRRRGRGRDHAARPGRRPVDGEGADQGAAGAVKSTWRGPPRRTPAPPSRWRQRRGARRTRSRSSAVTARSGRAARALCPPPSTR